MSAVGAAVRVFEVVRGADVLADGAEFTTEHGRPCVAVDRHAPMPVVYTTVRHLGMVYPESSIRWADDEDGA